MKECPVCKNKLSDDARFCLYCMTPLNEKQAIAALKPGFRRWLLPAILLVVAAVLLSVLWVIMMDGGSVPEKETQPPRLQAPESLVHSSGTTAPPQTSADPTQAYIDPNPQPVEGWWDGPAETGGPSAGTTPKATTPKNTTPDATTPKATTPKATTPKATTPKATTPKATPPKATTPKETTPKATTPKATTPKETTPKATTPKVTTAPTETTPLPPEVVGNGIPGSSGYRTSLSQSDPYEDFHQPFVPEPCGGMVYTLATPALMEDASYVNPGNEYVGVDVGSYTRSGIYNIPEGAGWMYDRGYQIVGIREYAFSGSDAVSVTFPPELRYIGPWVFCACDELAYVYLTGDRIRIHKNAFTPTVPRRYTVYLCCSAQCQDENGNYYKDIAGQYGVVWMEWNG